MARRRKRSARDSSASGVIQQPWAQPVNRFGPISIVSEDGLESLHQASLRLLQETGMEILSEDARNRFRKAGAEVDEATARVRLEADLVEEKITLAPDSFTLYARNPVHNLIFDDRHLVFTNATVPPYCSDIERGRRSGNYSDFNDLVRLCQSLNTLHCIYGYPVEPQDLPVGTRHLDAYASFIRLTDKVWRPTAVAPDSIRDGIQMAAISRGIGEAQLAREPGLITNISTNSPMKLDQPMADALIEMADAGQACVIASLAMAGATGPITLEGCLVQQNAEVLAGVVLSQIVRPGAPIVYGSLATSVHMKSGSPSFGTPEYMKAIIVAGQLARRYRLPLRSGNVNSSNIIDAQAIYESQMSIWGAVMGGVSLLNFGHGWMESGLCYSFEKMIIDSEMLQMVSEAMKPLSFQQDSLGLQAIEEVGPGGHFFAASQTLERYKDAFYQPMLSDWSNYEKWVEDGSMDTVQRAHLFWKQLLQDYKQPVLDPSIDEELSSFVEIRKQHISSSS